MYIRIATLGSHVDDGVENDEPVEFHTKQCARTSFEVTLQATPHNNATQLTVNMVNYSGPIVLSTPTSVLMVI